MQPISEWRNRNVVDPKGHKIGVLEAMYMDTTTDEPAMATVRKALVKKAPSVGLDDILPAGAEEAIFRHYDLPYQPGGDGGRQPARR
ncbi:hypothetical protein GCM10012280_69180 [Wenjunlia tyrosinilytica]|uniref:PRC-barrel domain containing protein n=1 Tax=Wenjunlia tyrosinilytica TaxID=1544741 RepID=A0A918E1L9_9ACTN|nr:hypothetical protein GCM10012280_69180 [Wenjunlia tyrosinilytica]